MSGCRRRMALPWRPDWNGLPGEPPPVLPSSERVVQCILPEGHGGACFHPEHQRRLDLKRGAAMTDAEREAVAAEVRRCGR